ncbi:VOC family protein [Spirillospora sp. NPDC047279]|uniref:VOC family protein n=1 Tax=Spirillospora sp. NPDC047279 TaxID=3155478 RepID=UPI0033C9D6DF
MTAGQREGSGFRGVSFHQIVPSADAVEEAIDKAAKAGATVVKAAEKAERGGCDGYFSDPDGYLWKVASAQ